MAMRFKQFLQDLSEDLLVEHDIEKTWQNYGEKIHARMKMDPTVPSDKPAAKRTEEDHKAILDAHINQMDPTPQKRYGQWMARSYANGGIKRMEDFGRAGEALGKFHTATQRKGFLQKHGINPDINGYKTMDELETAAEKIPQEETRAEVRDAASQKAFDESEHHEDKHWNVIIPKTEYAAKHYGKGTRWCTAADKNNYFNHYNKDGPMHIFIPKVPKYAGEKYQIHIPSNQFMNEKDNEVDVRNHPMDEDSERPSSYFEKLLS